MNHEPTPPPLPTVTSRSLEQRFASRPQVLARLRGLADLLDQALAAAGTADTTEARVRTQLQQLGRELLEDWAQQKQTGSLARARHQYPHAVRHIQKKVCWQTTFGPVTVTEQLLRLNRRGAELRPFCREAHVHHRGYSRRLQRVLTDFGAEVSFGQAVQRVAEHYAITVPVAAVRDHTLRHGRAIATLAPTPPATPVDQLITQIDGSLIPVMHSGPGADARQGRQLFWREVRLCCARPAGQATAFYGATLGSVAIAAGVWAATATAAGLGPRTRVHGVGDGAPWIATQFQENFGTQGTYLLDFYHVSEYLAAAALVIRPRQPHAWRHRQQGRLLQNQVGKVFRALQPHRETTPAALQPVNAAYQYLDQRRSQLDYVGAQRQGLPIGSGEIESGHRHVIQHRLKLPGCWWKEPHAQAMLNLRVARANQCWDAYWSNN